nr:protein UBASH3A homolog isoform X2 [Leptinotarsa decemlineata]
MTTLPPRRNPTPTKISKQHLTPLQTLLQMGFPKHRVEKALAATGHRGVQLASDWLLAHVNDPLLDDNSPREYILYACPTGPFSQQLEGFWDKSRSLCGWNGAHNFTPHITLVSFFKTPDEDALHLSQGLKSVMERQGAVLNEPLKLETYTSPNFMGFFVAEEHADYLKRIAMQYVKEVSNATISLEPHVKSLHLTLAYQFPSSHYSNLKSLVDELDPAASSGWELRLYSRDPRVNGKQVHKVIHAYNPTESDELDLRTGDYVYISGETLANSPDGWIEGTSWLTGQSGLLPESYTERTAESDAWTLHKKISLNQTSPSEASKESTRNIMSVPNQDAYIPSLPPMDDEVMSGRSIPASENIYMNMLELKKKEGLQKESAADGSPRNIFIMRHGERVDFTFGSWVPHCFDESNNYTRKDLNMPKTLPFRKDGAEGYLKDTPLTNVGVLQATLLGESFREKNMDIHYAYCSPALRSIMTCDGFLRGLNKKDQIKIRVEPGLFEWTAWYKDDVPGWMSIEELKNCGYNIDETYVPCVSVKDVHEYKEGCDQFYARNALITRSVITAHNTGNILLVGHSTTLETCSHELLGRKPKLPNDLIKIIQKIPYCALVQLTGNGDKWEMAEPVCLPMMHSNNQRFDWKMLFGE